MSPATAGGGAPRAARRWQIGGRVQGVGFRWFVRELARDLGLAGWVRNRPDGTVEVAAAGPAPALDRLEAGLREGPPGARVARVEPQEPAGLPAGGQGFHIVD